ncbi:hypothetical protein AKJ09_07438 [Labilithrix luteola]|uniref:Uncharacterized protein n=1 Tax=Labilithrix luteola TaxID=1391654 RepID=A0A0K1Q5V7_9BACT|nr:hypothetical protein AKJ09_07438 [Labilithrix luteola]
MQISDGRDAHWLRSVALLSLPALALLLGLGHSSPRHDLFRPMEIPGRSPAAGQ